MKVIETHQLSKYYGKSIGIKDVNLVVESGEIHGFIGPNGAGKSTTIRTLLGLLRPSSGNATIFGKDIIKEGHEIRKSIGYLPSEVSYYNGMTSLELLKFHVRFYPNARESDIHDYAEMFELDLKKPFEDLSFGNKKKCAIIQTVIHQPELIILDEPTSGLDPLMQTRFFELMQTENKRGATIFFSSHVLSEIQRLCSKATIIKNGVIIAQENISELLKKQIKRIHLKSTIEIKLEIEGASDIKYNQGTIEFNYAGGINPLLKYLSSFDLTDVTIEEPDLDTIFLNYYKK